jgi:hypothetical protein
LIGIFSAGNWSFATIYLIIASLTAFLIRQPITIAVKAYSGRRARRELKTAWFWITVYGIVGAASLAALVYQGYVYLLYLAVPGILVFVWHLFLVSRRAERRQLGVELVGSGVLALSAPAAYWVGVGYPASTGWILFFLTWLQSAASIVYAYLRLEQRTLSKIPPISQMLISGWRALLYSSFNLGISIAFSVSGITPQWLFLPFALQWLETIHGIFRPAIGIKPTAIGIRQLIISSLFTVLFIIAWNI